MPDALAALLSRFFVRSGGERGSGLSALRLALLWAALCVLSISGSLAALDGWLFDAVVRFAVRPAPPASVALVDAAGYEGADAARLLRAAGARRVAILVPLETPGLRGEGGGPCRPLPVQGVVRHLPLRDVAGRPCRLAVALNALVGGEPATERVSPDFSIATSTVLPRVRLMSTTSTDALRAAVDGRDVLVTTDATRSGYVTPLFRADGFLDEPLLDALLIDSASRGRLVRWLPSGYDVALALVIALALQIATRRRRYRTTMGIALCTAPLVLVLGGLLIRGAGIHLPMAAALLAIGTFAVRTILKRNRTLGDTLVDLDHRLTGLVQQPLNRTFAQSPDLTWDQVNHFVTRFFDLRRSVMLDLPAGGVHLVASSALGCKAADIIEKRRDYRRAPFAPAVARGRPMPPTRPFLPAVDGLVDLIAPLVAADQLVGIWAFSIAACDGDEMNALLLEATRYAEEVAKVVLRSRNAPPPIDDAARKTIPLAQVRSRLLDGASRAREQLAAYRDVFAAVGQPTAVTDVLGRILFTNPRFELLAASVSQPLLAMSVHDMLEQLCGLAPAEVKELLRRVMLQTNAEDVELPARRLDAAIDYSVRLHPIRHLARGTAVHGSPFDLLGLVVEISPSTVDADVASRLQRSMQEHLKRMRSLLEQSLATLERIPAADTARDVLADQLMRGVHEARKFDRMLEAATGRGAGAPASVDLVQLLYRARQACAAMANEKNLRVEVAEGGPRTVQAQPDALRAVIADAFALLVDDATPGGQVLARWTLRDDGQMVVLEMSNDGYGLPPWHVAEVMRAGGAVALAGGAASLLDRLAQSAQLLDATAPLSVESELGKGYTVRMQLPRDRSFVAP